MSSTHMDHCGWCPLKPPLLVGPLQKQNEKPGPQDIKEKRDFLSRRSLREILHQKAASSGAPLRGPAAISETTVEISAKGRRNQW
jgi:hypothetical protein